uniref:BPTI/Kunitz inhibitor domain-containing protein n=1 Tax=Rhipicephalus sanguineus TaxID=34632 RepID=C9W1N1_RHISA
MIFVMAAVLASSVVELSEASGTNQSCGDPIQELGGACSNTEVKQRWGYDSSSGKCVKFLSWDCKKNRNNFPTVKECLETCNRDSQCLKDPKRFSLPFHETFYFNVNKEKCEKKRTTNKRTSKKNNRFGSEKECMDQCMPKNFELITHSMQ